MNTFSHGSAGSAALGHFKHIYQPGSSPWTVLALHGTGGSESDLIPLTGNLWPGAAVLSPLGNISEHGAARFFRRFAEGLFDLENLRDETAKLGDFIAAASAEYGFDPAKVVALGYSNGANIAASLLLSRPQALAGGVLLRAMTPYRPVTPPDLRGKSVFCAAGRVDPMVSLENVRELAHILESAGAHVDLHIENASHNLTPSDLTAARDFIVSNFA